MTIFELQLFGLNIAPSYYWLMYAIWFILWYYIILKRWIIDKSKLDDLFLYIFLWVVLWGRFWYIIFYDLSYYLQNLSSVIKVWEWWMSFHGWVIWVLLAMFLFSKRHKVDFLKLADQIVLVLPIWLWFWRIWNYLNNELLWYANYNWPFWILIDWVKYFPSTLLEAFLEWLVLLIILNYFYFKNNLKKWQIAALFLVFYWLFRLFVEIFFRQPDSHIWYIFWFLTMWEILTFPMLIAWIIIFLKLKNVK